MPELPEVERVRRTLTPHLVGRRVTAVKLLRSDIWTPAPKPGKGGGRSPSPRDQLLLGAVIRAVVRHGKQIAIIAQDDRTLSVHLGMTGQLVFRAADAPRKKTGHSAHHIHARWTLVDAQGPRGELVFRDPRRFGGLWSFRSFQQLQDLRWSELGPDALAADPKDLQTRLHASARPIKAALLDQSVIAGVGNIYADEALFESGIHPRTHCTRLTSSDWERLAQAIRCVLERALDAGGSTLRDYVDADGQPGGARATHRVYGRAGKPCLSCGSRLGRAVIAQRTTVFCSHCQPLRKMKDFQHTEFSTR